MLFLYIDLFYNFHIHSTCFERSSCSSTGVYRSALYNTHSSVHYDKRLLMNDSIFRNM